jgi:hypothetical protein
LIDSTLKEQFLDYEFESIVHPLVQEYFTRDEVIGNLAREIDADISKGTDASFAERFRNLCPVSNASAADYMIRHLEIAPGFDILAGIRFRGLDLNRPFVAILHRTRSFASDDELRLATDRLRETFGTFAPKAILFYQSSHDKTLALPVEDIDKRILMGSIPEIATIASAPELSIAKANELDFYDRYKDEYDIISMRSPDYLRTETAERKEDMERYVKNDLTYKIFIGGEFAGVFIVMKSTFLGADGYYVIENLLFEQFRGRKLADAVQSAVAKELLVLKGKVLFGSIYPTNLPSYRAALRSHRVDIGGNYMIPIER